MTAIGGSLALSMPRQIAGETAQSGAVGALIGGATGLGFAATVGTFHGPGLAIGVIGGGLIGAGIGLSRGSVDSLTGKGAGPALAQTAAGAVGGVAAGYGAMKLLSVLPGTRHVMNHSSGAPAFAATVALAVAGVAALTIPPVLDKLFS